MARQDLYVGQQVDFGSSIIFACKEIGTEAQPRLRRKFNELQHEPTRFIWDARGARLCYSELPRAMSFRPARNIQIAVLGGSGRVGVQDVAFAVIDHVRSDVDVSMRIAYKSKMLATSTRETLEGDLEWKNGNAVLRVYHGGELGDSEWEVDWA